MTLFSSLRRTRACQVWLRSFFLLLFSRINPGDVTVKHAITHDPILLHSFRYRGFWFHGKENKEEITRLRESWPGKENVVVEVDGHIRYLKVPLSRLAGPKGSVIAFGPGSYNLTYLQSNIKSLSNLNVESCALGETSKTVDFFLENLTGQNKAQLNDYGNYQRNQESTHLKHSFETMRAEITSLDTYGHARELKPGGLKTGVEGYELGMPQGSSMVMASSARTIAFKITEQHADSISTANKHR